MTTDIPTPAQLKPCPFCGRDDVLSTWNGCSTPGMEDCGYWSTGCSSCGIEFHRDDQEAAESDWNSRDERELHEAKARLEASQHLMDLDLRQVRSELANALQQETVLRMLLEASQQREQRLREALETISRRLFGLEGDYGVTSIAKAALSTTTPP